jgi:hypothetical protein
MLWQRSNIGSRVNREVHARFWERAEVQFFRATRQFAASRQAAALIDEAESAPKRGRAGAKILLQSRTARREAAVTAVGTKLIVAEGIERASRSGDAGAIAANGRSADFEIHA